MPFLFACLKVAIAISLVGAIVGELPTGATAGLGARLLTGSYYGQTVQIWSALVMAALLGAGLVYLVALIERRGARAGWGCAGEAASRFRRDPHGGRHRACRRGSSSTAARPGWRIPVALASGVLGLLAAGFAATPARA